jgi:glycerophosphoryl diester phosphodiesterase
MKLKSFFGILLCLVTITIGNTQFVSAAMPCPMVIAHKGNTYSGGPSENSINAFTNAFNIGSQWVETDVHFTSDSVPVLMHNPTVDDATDGTGAIASMTAAKFTSLHLADGQHPPTLDQLMAVLLANPNRHLLLEMKAATITTAQEQILLQKLQGHEDQVYIYAFANRYPTVQHLKAADPAFTTSILGYDPILPPPAGIASEDLEYTYLTQARVDQLHALGLKVKAWTPDNATAWASMRQMGVDVVITNKSRDYLNWAKATCPADPTPSAPIVSMSAPTASSTVSGTTTISANASDAGAITSVQFQLNGANLGNAVTSAPYSLDWDTTAVADGTYTLRAVATNSASLQTTSQQVTVTVKNTVTVPPTTVEYVINKSFESDITGWTGLWSANSKSTRIAGGYDGGYSIRSVNTSSAAAAHGFTTKPEVLDGVTNATVAGKAYAATAWVRPDSVGQKLNLYVRERDIAGNTVGSKTVTVTTKDTNWQQITNTYGAAHTGDRISITIYSASSATNKGFNADLISFIGVQ